MRLFQIQDQKEFMKQLLMGDGFDTFLLSEASITTFATFMIDGRFHADFLPASEQEMLGAEKTGYTLWSRTRPYFYSLMRGKNTPLNFRIIFRLAEHNVETMLKKGGLTLTKEDIDGLFLNIGFDGKSLSCTSGTSLKSFSLDKSVERAWDELVERFLKSRGIPFT